MIKKRQLTGKLEYKIENSLQNTSSTKHLHILSAKLKSSWL